MAKWSEKPLRVALITRNPKAVFAVRKALQTARVGEFNLQWLTPEDNGVPSCQHPAPHVLLSDLENPAGEIEAGPGLGGEEARVMLDAVAAALLAERIRIIPRRFI